MKRSRGIGGPAALSTCLYFQLQFPRRIADLRIDHFSLIHDTLGDAVWVHNYQQYLA